MQNDMNVNLMPTSTIFWIYILARWTRPEEKTKETIFPSGYEQIKGMAIKSNAFILKHIRPNYSFTKIYMNWIASWDEWTTPNAHSINEMRFILDDNFVFNGLTSFIL